MKVLAETDATVYALRKGFSLQKADGSSVTTKLDDLLHDGDVGLTELNAAFGNCTRTHVFAQPTHCYEMRVMDNGSILEVKYQADPISDDQIFNEEGLKPGGAAVSTKKP